jgi:BASS family bile acid:Na+ symporter
LINVSGVLFVVVNSFALGLRLPVGKLLAGTLAHWRIAVWALVINFVIIPLLFVGYLLTIASSIPGEIKVGFCVAALSAGMPFAPLLARLAKADVVVATTLLVLLTAGTIIALPLGLPFAIDAVDAPLDASAWDIAWPLLLFLVLPVVLGCGIRVWWPALTPPLMKWAVRGAILFLLVNVNFTLVAFWDLFVDTWGTRSYIAAIAGPFIGLGCGYLLVSSLRVKDVAIRHAAEATTAVRNIAPMLLMMIFPFGTDPLVTVSITILNTIGITIVLLFVLMWRRASSIPVQE